MRKTTLGFAAEKKKHLDAMLEKVVIQPTASDWASAPLLFRTKALRYCVDYRVLNNVTVQDAFAFQTLALVLTPSKTVKSRVHSI